MLTNLEVFIKVIELGSFSSAARVLGVSPSSISRQMDKLEAEFGTRLLNRSTHTVAPTSAGLRLIPFAENALTQMDMARLSVRQDLSEPQGILRISVFESFGRLFVCPLVLDFLKLYPKVKVILDTSDRMVDLHKENVDIAIRTGQLQDSSLKARRLLLMKPVVVASPDYLAKYGAPEEPEDLKHHNCLVLDRQRQVSWWHFRQGTYYRKVPVSGNLQSPGGEPLAQAARAGLGITMLTHWMLQKDITSGALVRVLDGWKGGFTEQGEKAVDALFLPDRYERPALRAFIDFMVERFRAMEQS